MNPRNSYPYNPENIANTFNPGNPAMNVGQSPSTSGLPTQSANVIPPGFMRYPPVGGIIRASGFTFGDPGYSGGSLYSTWSPGNPRMASNILPGDVRMTNYNQGYADALRQYARQPAEQELLNNWSQYQMGLGGQLRPILPIPSGQILEWPNGRMSAESSMPAINGYAGQRPILPRAGGQILELPNARMLVDGSIPVMNGSVGQPRPFLPRPSGQMFEWQNGRMLVDGPNPAMNKPTTLVSHPKRAMQKPLDLSARSKEPGQNRAHTGSKTNTKGQTKPSRKNPERRGRPLAVPLECPICHRKLMTRKQFDFHLQTHEETEHSEEGPEIIIDETTTSSGVKQEQAD